MYETVTKPYVERVELGDHISWVINVIEKKKEAERILFEDPDPQV